MITNRSWRTAVNLVLGCVMALAGGLAQAEETAPVSDTPPVVVINVASVERLLKGADLAFESAGRPELSETMSGWLANVNDLKGLNRDQSMGLMVFINGLTPEFVAYVPLQNIDDLLKTVAIGPVTTKKTAEGQYEIAGPRQILYARVKGEYAFIANSPLTLERVLPDPAKITGRLSTNYDIAISANLAALPKSSRDIFLGLLRGRADADLQRRDNESEGAYKVRKAAGRNNLRVIEQLLTQGEEFLIGWSVSEKDRNAGLEFLVRATPGSEMANSMNTLGSARSHFANLLAMPSPLTLSASWKFDKPDRKAVQDMLEGIEQELSAKLPLATEGGATQNPLTALFTVLKGTAENGHLDAILQLVRTEAGTPYSWAGGIKVSDAAALAPALADLLGRFQNNAQFSSVQLNAASYRGVTLHRLQQASIPAREQQRYGEGAGVYLGAGEGVLWFAVGGDAALPALRKMMDETAKPASTAVSTPPFQLVANFAQLMDFFSRDANSQRSQRTRDAFAKGGDALKIDVRPVQDGMRVRVQFDEAFLRLSGLSVARQVDRQQQRQQEAK